MTTPSNANALDVSSTLLNSTNENFFSTLMYEFTTGGPSSPFAPFTATRALLKNFVTSASVVVGATPPT